jgi:hypothetical protein
MKSTEEFDESTSCFAVFEETLSDGFFLSK